ncbi:MAG TPA: hypothetical protein VIZ68_00230 [Thermoplasmata archaeon]
MDVYLFPSVVGGGRGDVEEVLIVGRRLARAGAPVYLLRGPGRRLPTGIDASFAWPPHRKITVPARTRARAITVSSYFGATAEGARGGPLGGAGPWSEERDAVERAYGIGDTLHVSLEEFARTGSARWHAEERWREGGMNRRDRIARRSTPEGRRDLVEFRALYRKFRAFDRSNLLALFPGFLPSGAFARECPESVQCGPLWPSPPQPRYRPGPAGAARSVVWYAGPSSSGRIAGPVLEGLASARVPVRMTVRSSRPMVLRPSGPIRVDVVGSLPSPAWAARWRRADLAIVSGSRTLLEAIERGVPFLYFNGLLGRGPATRRHRPEKIVGLLRWLRAEHAPLRVRRALSEFSRGRRVPDSVRAALTARGRGTWVPRRSRSSAYPPGFGDAGTLIESLARRFGGEPIDAPSLVRSVRAASRVLGTPRGPSKA